MKIASKHPVTFQSKVTARRVRWSSPKVWSTTPDHEGEPAREAVTDATLHSMEVNCRRYITAKWVIFRR
jgi:hypothetical protein